MKERTKFVLEWERLFEKNRGMVNLSELCRAYGISRPTGYTWLTRYRAAGRDVRVLENRSRRPHSNPNAMSLDVEATLVAARKLHPRWGPRKLRAWLQDRFPDHTFPSPSTIGEALKRHGLVESRRRRRRRAPVAAAPFAEPNAANGVWCIDFKGHFRTDDHAVCYPFTISDAFSRFLIRCEMRGHSRPWLAMPRPRDATTFWTRRRRRTCSSSRRRSTCSGASKTRSVRTRPSR